MHAGTAPACPACRTGCGRNNSDADMGNQDWRHAWSYRRQHTKVLLITRRSHARDAAPAHLRWTCGAGAEGMPIVRAGGPRLSSTRFFTPSQQGLRPAQQPPRQRWRKERCPFARFRLPGAHERIRPSVGCAPASIRFFRKCCVGRCARVALRLFASPRVSRMSRFLNRRILNGSQAEGHPRNRSLSNRCRAGVACIERGTRSRSPGSPA